MTKRVAALRAIHLPFYISLVNTSRWAIQPVPNTFFRIEQYRFICWGKIGNWALIRQVGKET